MNCHEFFSSFASLSGCELVALASLLSVAISKDLSNDEIGSLGNFFLLLEVTFPQLQIKTIYYLININLKLLLSL